MNKIGIIGGSGLYNPELFQQSSDLQAETPYGATSSPVKHGKVGDTDIYIIARHGRQHSITPTKVNNRANIWALKELDCNAIIATTAVGSLRNKIEPGHFVLPDQFIDFTRFRANTFFDKFESGQMKHTPMANPFDHKLRKQIAASLMDLGYVFHQQGTVITIEGPRFSTRAESLMFRQWGADIINMSTAPECILANELEIPYAAIAMSTDYDCWKLDEKPVSWEQVVQVFNKNVERVVGVLRQTIERL